MPLDWLSHTNRFPKCRQPAIVSNMVLNFDLNSVIGVFKLTCVHPGCDWEGKIDDYVSHSDSCLFNPEKMTAIVAAQMPSPLSLYDRRWVAVA